MKNKRLKLLKDKELRNKFLADQVKIGLRYQLRSLRDSQNLTQKDLAELIGTKQSVISRLERNAARVSIPTLLDIAEALDVGVVVRFESIDTVLDWYNTPTQKKMTPRKSEEVLKEVESQQHLGRNIYEDAVINSELISEFTENRRIKWESAYTQTAAHSLLGILNNYAKKTKDDEVVYANDKGGQLRSSRHKTSRDEKISIDNESYTIPTQDFSNLEIPN